MSPIALHVCSIRYIIIPPPAPKQWRKCDRLDRKNSYLFFEVLTHALDVDNDLVNNSRSVLK